MARKSNNTRYLFISDVHGNLEALNAVIEDAEKKFGFYRIVCLGDVIGYGANPNECLNLLKQRNAVVLMGNHEAAINGLLSYEWFNEYARESLIWTEKKLTEDNKKFIAELPKFFAFNILLCVHGTPKEPLTGYMQEEKAKEAFEICTESFIFCGHNHVCFTIDEKLNVKKITKNAEIELNKRMVVSLPSVGQPRDGNNKAGYCILDFKKMMLFVRRVSYDIDKAAEKIRLAGLPEFNAQRLYEGI